MTAVHWYPAKSDEIVLFEATLDFISGDSREHMVKYELRTKRLTPLDKRTPYKIAVYEWVAYKKDIAALEAVIKSGVRPPDVTLRVFDPEKFAT